MKNKEYFLRRDLETYTKKFFLVCSPCKAPLNLIEVFTPIKEETRLKQIKISEIL